MADKVIASFSGGRSSAMMCVEMIRRGEPPAEILFCNTSMETAQTYDFLEAVNRAFFEPAGIKFTRLEFAPSADGKTKRSFRIVSAADITRDGEVFEYLVSTVRMPNKITRTCTQEMKVDTVRRYLRSLDNDYADIIRAIGFRADEPHRLARMRARNDAAARGDKRDFEVTAPLATYGITRPDVFAFWRKEEKALGLPFSVSSPEIHLSNCDGCFYGGIGEQIRLAQRDPARARMWAELEKISNDRQEEAIKKGGKKRSEYVDSTSAKKRVIWIGKNLNRKSTPEDILANAMNEAWRWEHIIELAARDGGGSLNLSGNDFRVGGCADGECGVDI